MYCTLRRAQMLTNHKVHMKNLLFRMHVSNVNKPGIRGPEIHKRGVVKTGGVTADKAAAALSAPGT